MKKLALIITLTLMTTQAHAVGWFLLGMAVGSGDNNTTVMRGSNSSKYLEVYRGSCYHQRSEKIMLNSGLIKHIGQPRHVSKNNKNCTLVQVHEDQYHIKANYEEVKKKLFGEMKK